MGRKMPRVRIINFSSVEIKTFPSVKLRDSPMDSAIATVRKYADQPVVYVADAGQYEHVAGIAATLATMHSPCYPHAVYFVGGPSPAPAIPGADVFVLADPEGLEDRIAAYALAAFVFDKRRLIIENENALPDRVDVLIVGGGINPSGKNEAWLVELWGGPVPEPLTMVGVLLSGTGLACYLRGRRRAIF